MQFYEGDHLKFAAQIKFFLLLASISSYIDLIAKILNTLKDPPKLLIAIGLYNGICNLLWEEGSYSFSNYMYLTIHNVTCEHGTSMKFGHFVLLT